MASSVTTNRYSFCTECIGYHLGIVTGKKKSSITMVCAQTAHSPSTRSLARPPRNAPAAISRAYGHGSTHWQRPGRREHADVPVDVLCAHNGTQHQHKHKTTTHSSKKPLAGSCWRARTRSKPWNHGLTTAHARLAPHRPQQPHIAPQCTMGDTTLSTIPPLLHTHTTTTPGNTAAAQPGTSARTQRKRPHGTQQHAKHSAAQRRARQRLFLPRTPAHLHARA